MAVRDLAKIVAKELADNALDAAESCTFGRLKRGGFYVQNEGDIPGKKRDVAALFSTGRPQTSTKLYRRPMRGALGNGLRVVAGAVLASGGRLVVRTGGRCLLLKPRPDGTTAVRKFSTARPLRAGVTRVAVWLGPSIPVGEDVLDWVKLAAELAAAPNGRPPAKRPSVHWHTLDSFAGLLRDSGSATVHQMARVFDGLSGPKASEVCGGLSGPASGVLRSNAADLLGRMKAAANPPSREALGRVGDLPGWGRPRREEASFNKEVPARVEVWARPAQEFKITVCVNRTPCPAEVRLGIGKSNKGQLGIVVSGAGLSRWFPGRGRRPVEVLVNVQCPAVPMVSDGKAPDLGPIKTELMTAVEKAVKAATRGAASFTAAGGRPAKKVHQIAVVYTHVRAAAQSISLNWTVKYTLRNLFYALRPRLIAAIDGGDPGYNTFSKNVAVYEEKHGELPNLCRDNRGTLYEPHTGKSMPLGTVTAKAYKRPPFLFNKVLYCEKEGFFPQLIAAGWPERHDCALLTSKGFATRAVADLLAAMEESDEPLTIFCVHDADGPGTVIYQALKELVNRRAGAGRDIRVVDLGLNPDEATGPKFNPPLQVETFRRSKKVPTGDKMSPEWREWLQTQRVELNAIPPAEFLGWLDGKMVGHAGKKVVPPDPVVLERVRAAGEKEVRERVREQLLEAGRYEALVEAEMARRRPAFESAAALLSSDLVTRLTDSPKMHWSGVADEAGVELVAAEAGPESASPGED